MPSLSRILVTMEKRQLLRRRKVSSDRRRAIISISAKGKKLFAQVAPEAEAHYARIAETLGTEKLEQLYELLDETYVALMAAQNQADGPPD